MTPYEINLLLKIHTSPPPHGDPGHELYAETVAAFYSEGLVIGSPMNAGLTAMGEAHVAQLCALPFPTEQTQWVDFSGKPIQVHE